MAETVNLTIRQKSDQKAFQVRRGLGLLAISKKLQLGIEFDCCKADCGICIIRVRSGMDQLSAKTPQEHDFLKAMRAQPDERLSCQTRIFGDATIEYESFI